MIILNDYYMAWAAIESGAVGNSLTGLDERHWAGTNIPTITPSSLIIGTIPTISAAKLPARPFIEMEVLCTWIGTTSNAEINISKDGTTNGYRFTCSKPDTTYMFSLEKYTDGAWVSIAKYDTGSGTAPATEWKSFRMYLYYDRMEVHYGDIHLFSTDSAYRGIDSYLRLSPAYSNPKIHTFQIRYGGLSSLTENELDFARPLSQKPAWTTATTYDTEKLTFAAGFDVTYKPYLLSKCGWKLVMAFSTWPTGVKIGVRSKDQTMGAYLETNSSYQVRLCNIAGTELASYATAPAGSKLTLTLYAYQTSILGTTAFTLKAILDGTASDSSVNCNFELPNGGEIFMTDTASSGMVMTYLYLAQPTEEAGFKYASTLMAGLSQAVTGSMNINPSSGMPTSGGGIK